ncbi:uncharacterized protein LOC143150404 [Ptiloglossa arizonensis]|uniref:uncharacterized protein LOC143150404 n=1 Tax=Ptiloglossa arizonensis TaxID=3350558 RepID=UPI003FA0712A
MRIWSLFVKSVLSESTHATFSTKITIPKRWYTLPRGLHLDSPKQCQVAPRFWSSVAPGSFEDRKMESNQNNKHSPPRIYIYLFGSCAETRRNTFRLINGL